MTKDTNYYNKESLVYSKKRYPKKESYFVHFLFKERLRILLKNINKIFKDKNNLRLLEIGCADGYVLQSINKNTKFFSKMVGTDISPEMINTAIKNNNNENIEFILREKGILENKKFGLVLEIGVLNLVNLDEEFNYVFNKMNDNGYYICSLATKTSLLNKLKPGAENDFNHFLTFSEYEKIIKKYFSIENSFSYALFIPYIWKSKRFGFGLQNIFEKVFKYITPSLFHEKLYFLKKK